MLARLNGPVVLIALVLAAPSGVSAQVGVLAPAQHKSVGVGLMRQGDEPMTVSEVLAGSPAEKAGLKTGDQIVSIAGISPSDIDPDRLHAISDTAKVVAFVVLRDGKKLTLNVEPAFLPGAPMGTHEEHH